MAEVHAQASVSVDGFIATPTDGGFDHLFAWVTNGDVVTPTSDPERVTFRTSAASAGYVREMIEGTGAVVVGRRFFDVVKGWGGTHPLGAPVYVVTHRPPPDDWQDRGTPFTFVNGLEDAVSQAKKIAGEKAVGIGPGQVVWQALDEGLVDELRIDLVPVLLGAGRRMVDNLRTAPIGLGQPRVIEGTGVTHLIYRVTRP